MLAKVLASVSHFNSIKVRLEQVFDRPFGALAKFQFHKGTIRTIHKELSECWFTNFNSIKVRLELPSNPTVNAPD